MNLQSALNFADSGETTGGTSTALALARLAQEVRDLQKQIDDITDGRDRAMEDSDWARQYREACVKICQQNEQIESLEARLKIALDNIKRRVGEEVYSIKDTARLDWLEGVKLDNHREEAGMWTTVLYRTHAGKKYQTVREAMDAARHDANVKGEPRP